MTPHERAVTAQAHAKTTRDACAWSVAADAWEVCGDLPSAAMCRWFVEVLTATSVRRALELEEVVFRWPPEHQVDAFETIANVLDRQKYSTGARVRRDWADTIRERLPR